MRSYIESTEHEVHELKVRFDKLRDIWSKYEKYQEELEGFDDTTDHSADRERFEHQYCYDEAKFNEVLTPVVTHRSTLS
jgi:hypothetical protein